MDNSNVTCFRCKQTGHRKADCPHRQAPKLPAAASARATAAPRPYRRTDLIECPVCQHDWVAIFTAPAQPLFSTYCPWCRTFQSDDDGTIRRREGASCG